MIDRIRRSAGVVSALTLALALCLVVACSMGASKAYAAEAYSFDPSENWTVAPPMGGYSNSVYFSIVDGDGFWADDVSITDVKSSNKKVAKAKVSEISSYVEVKYGQKTGSTIISCKVNGKTVQRKFTVKYTCPVKKFKVGKVNALKTFKKKNTFVTKKVLKKKKVKIKTKKGWVITQVSTQAGPKYKVKHIKNKTSLSMKATIKNPLDSVQVTFMNKKTGEEQYLSFQKYWDTRYATAQ